MLGMIREAVGAASRVFDRWQEHRKLRQDAEALHRLLQLECRRNLALLGALRPDDDSQDDPAYRHVAKQLEVDILEQLFLPGKASLTMLERLEKATEDPAQDEDPPDQTDPTGLLMRLYVRIVTVQKLADMPVEGDALRRIRFRTRLDNIRARSLAILRTLESQEPRTSKRRRLKA